RWDHDRPPRPALELGARGAPALAPRGAEGAWDWITWAAGHVGKMVSVLFGAGMNLLGTGVNSAWAWVQWLWNGVANGASVWFGAGMTLLNNVANSAWSWVAWLWDVAQGGWRVGFDATLTLLADTWDCIKRLWNGFTANVGVAAGSSLSNLGH